MKIYPFFIFFLLVILPCGLYWVFWGDDTDSFRNFCIGAAVGYALVGLGVFLRSRSRLNKIRFTARELGKIRTRLVVIDDEGRRVHYRIASGNREELERLEAKEEDLVAELEEKKPE